MPADTSVKFIHSAMAGAPVLNGQAGTLIALLDACLVNGFGVGAVDSLVIASGVATVTRSAGHPFEIGSVALIAGATVTGGVINGERKVTAVTTTTYQFDATGIPDQTASGSITHKVAPVGWAKPFSGTNLAAYQSTDPEATGCLLRVDDTSTISARVVGYETMSDVNTGTGPFPTAAQISGGGYWTKAHAADANARPWMLFADSRIFYLAVASSTTQPAQYLVHACFGDFLSVNPGAYDCMIYARSATFTSNPATGTTVGIAADMLAETQCTAARGYSKLGSAVPLARREAGWYTGSSTHSGADGPAFPNPVDGGLYVASMVLLEGTTALRGELPGLAYALQAIGGSVFSPRAPVQMGPKTLVAVPNGGGVVFFDATGPWRS